VKSRGVLQLWSSPALTKNCKRSSTVVVSAGTTVDVPPTDCVFN
jgi:hypothetical protein